MAALGQLEPEGLFQGNIWPWLIPELKSSASGWLEGTIQCYLGRPECKATRLAVKVLRFDHSQALEENLSKQCFGKKLCLHYRPKLSIQISQTNHIEGAFWG